MTYVHGLEKKVGSPLLATSLASEIRYLNNRGMLQQPFRSGSIPELKAGLNHRSQTFKNHLFITEKVVEDTNLDHQDSRVETNPENHRVSLTLPVLELFKSLKYRDTKIVEQ